MNYYNEIKDKLIDVEIQNKVKDYSKNKYTLEKYYEIGKLLIEAQGGETRAKYGDGLIKEYAIRLSSKIGKKYSATTLKYIRMFYLYVKSQPMADQLKVDSLNTQLSWSHYVELLPLKDINVIDYYINKCIQNNLSRNKLNKLKKDNIGQILCYMNYIDSNLKKINHNKTVGIILTKKDNHFVAEYCSNYNILSREYIVC